MNKKIINSIQIQSKKLTKKKYSKKYIITYILPIIEYIVSSKKTNFLISGSQGSGKTTLIKILEKNINLFYNKKILTLSLDDYYLSKKERISLSKKKHDLFLTRGVPGTHDTKLLIKNLNQIKKKQNPINLPIFDKLNDDKSKKVKKINYKADIIILEGWCCDSSPIKKYYLKKNINNLERIKDDKMIWRKYYNKCLQDDYAKIFKSFDKTIFLEIPSFNFVLNWRLKQEKMMQRDKKNKNIRVMNKKDIKKFISHYEKITKWMLKILPYKSDMVLKINKSQKIFKIKYN